MAEPLKTFFSAALLRRLAADIVRVEASFPSRAFVRDATAGLARLELLARGRHIARALANHLPPEYPKAIEVLLRSLGPEHASDELVGAGMAPFYSQRCDAQTAAARAACAALSRQVGTPRRAHRSGSRCPPPRSS